MKKIVVFQIFYGALWILLGAEFFLVNLLAPGVELPLPTLLWGMLTVVEVFGGAMLMVGGRWSPQGIKVLSLPMILLIFCLPYFSLIGVTAFYLLVIAHVMLAMASFPVLHSVRWHTK